MRECIIETKWKYDVASEDKQVAWKALILNFMERYFYLICFATYALEHGPTGYQKSFVSWMDEHQDLRTMIGEEICQGQGGPGMVTIRVPQFLESHLSLLEYCTLKSKR